MNPKKKIKGRPSLTTGLKNKKIDARFTEEEFNSILDLEKELGIRRTDLVRMRVLHNVKNIVVNASQLIAHLDQIGTEMARSGNNINQLAKYANTLNQRGILSNVVAERYIALLEEYNYIHKDLEVALRKIIRQMSS